MHRYAKLLLASLTATAILALAVGSASANRLSFSARTFRASWTELAFSGGGSTITCPVTLEGSFHSFTITKTTGALVGYVTRASVNGESRSCTGGTATIRQERLPWHIRYRGFTGTLPRISAINLGLIGLSYRVRNSSSVECNVTSEASHPEVVSIALSEEQVAEDLTPDPTARIPLEEGICALSGEGSFEDESETLCEVPGSRITITLI